MFTVLSLATLLSKIDLPSGGKRTVTEAMLINRRIPSARRIPHLLCSTCSTYCDIEAGREPDA
eukprot:9900233-Prorocentrum_lima.AAC.1